MNGRGATWIMAVIVASLVGGCAKGDTALRGWIDEVKRREKPAVEPIPFLPPYEKFVYIATYLRDPYENTLRRREAENTAAVGQGGKSGVKPPVNLRPEPLESFPLDALSMVGTLQQNDLLWAIIRSPDETVTRVSVGNRLGQNYGRITAVREFDIQLIEIVSDGAGGWMEREASIAIVEPSS